MTKLLFHRCVSEDREVSYEAHFPHDESPSYYEIYRAGDGRWVVSIQRPLTDFASHPAHMAADHRFSDKDYRTLQEAQAACQRHYDMENAVIAGAEALRKAFPTLEHDFMPAWFEKAARVVLDAACEIAKEH